MKKHYIGIFLPLIILPFQSTLASSSYTTNSTLEYTITAENQNSVSNDLSNLSISADSYITPQAESPSSHASISDSTNLIGLNTPHTIIFSAQDSINSGSYFIEYFHNLDLSFENSSTDTNDVFDISINYSYTLAVEANGQAADTELSSDIYNADENWLDGITISAQNSLIPNSENDSFSGEISFTLYANEAQTFYFESVSGADLEVASVPLPAAFWLFGTGVFALISRKKLLI